MTDTQLAATALTCWAAGWTLVGAAAVTLTADRRRRRHRIGRAAPTSDRGGPFGASPHGPDRPGRFDAQTNETG